MTENLEFQFRVSRVIENSLYEGNNRKIPVFGRLWTEIIVKTQQKIGLDIVIEMKWPENNSRWFLTISVLNNSRKSRFLI